MLTVVDLVQSTRMCNHLTIHVHAYDQTLSWKRYVWNFLRRWSFCSFCDCLWVHMFRDGLSIVSHSNANNWAQISYGAFSVLVVGVFWTNMKKKIEQEKKSNIWTWDSFGPYLRGGLGTHKVMSIMTWETV
jgi:hypothetical protein